MTKQSRTVKLIDGKDWTHFLVYSIKGISMSDALGKKIIKCGSWNKFIKKVKENKIFNQKTISVNKNNRRYNKNVYNLKFDEVILKIYSELDKEINECVENSKKKLEKQKMKLLKKITRKKIIESNENGGYNKIEYNNGNKLVKEITHKKRSGKNIKELENEINDEIGGIYDEEFKNERIYNKLTQEEINEINKDNSYKELTPEDIEQFNRKEKLMFIKMEIVRLISRISQLNEIKVSLQLDSGKLKNSLAIYLLTNGVRGQTFREIISKLILNNNPNIKMLLQRALQNKIIKVRNKKIINKFVLDII